MTVSRRIVRRQRTSTGDALPDSLHPVLRRVYGARGVRSPDALELGLERLLPVGSLGGVPAAVDLLLRCHRDGRRVLVLGDFDADGATSTALMIRQLRRLRFADPQFLVPDRFRFGYGLTPELVRAIAHALGVAPRLFAFPQALLRFAGACAGRAAAVERLVGSLEADTSAFRGRFAWAPPRTLAEELADAFAPGAPL